MRSQPHRENAAPAPAEVRIVPIARHHLAGFHAALDQVAREGRHLALLEAPSFVRTRRFILDSLKAGAVHVVAGPPGPHLRAFAQTHRLPGAAIIDLNEIIERLSHGRPGKWLPVAPKPRRQRGKKPNASVSWRLRTLLRI